MIGLLIGQLCRTLLLKGRSGLGKWRSIFGKWRSALGKLRSIVGKFTISQNTSKLPPSGCLDSATKVPADTKSPLHYSISMGGLKEIFNYYAFIAANDFSIASKVFSMSSSVWAVDKNNPSNWDGGKKTPLLAISRKNFPKYPKSEDLATS